MATQKELNDAFEVIENAKLDLKTAINKLLNLVVSRRDEEIIDINELNAMLSEYGISTTITDQKLSEYCKFIDFLVKDFEVETVDSLPIPYYPGNIKVKVTAPGFFNHSVSSQDFDSTPLETSEGYRIFELVHGRNTTDRLKTMMYTASAYNIFSQSFSKSNTVTQMPMPDLMIGFNNSLSETSKTFDDVSDDLTYPLYIYRNDSSLQVNRKYAGITELSFSSPSYIQIQPYSNENTYDNRQYNLVILKNDSNKDTHDTVTLSMTGYNGKSSQLTLDITRKGVITGLRLVRRYSFHNFNLGTGYELTFSASERTFTLSGTISSGTVKEILITSNTLEDSVIEGLVDFFEYCNLLNDSDAIEVTITGNNGTSLHTTIYKDTADQALAGIATITFS